ncbi:MAG: M20/M25/M40 family metallo-hydrolase, partial [Firmicutes bacterium]|nr:M20/M25/M40 family metallo-hydrolase [Bacillota bacterium]
VETGIRKILDMTDEGITIEYSITLNRPPLAPVPGSQELIDTVKKAGEELDIPFRFVEAGGVSDGNFVSAAGVPTIDGMGPSGGMMCSPEEYLELDTMVPCAARLALTLAKLAES